MKNLFFLLCTLPYFINAQILQLGKAVVTSEGAGPADYVVHVLDIRNPQNAPLGYDWPGAKLTNAGWVRGSNTAFAGCQNCSGIGNVFGIAYDHSAPPNIYVAATNIYKSTFYGFGGAGAIYKVDRLNGNPSQVTGTSSSYINHDSVVSRTIWNTGPGLGNICSPAGGKYLFATNFEDGKIYKINAATGEVKATYDPFEDDDKLAGYCALGERIWGVAFYDNKLYFSRWAEDAARTTPGIRNGIYSITLSAADLEFPGTVNADGSYYNATETLEIEGGSALIPNYPNDLSAYAGTTASYPNLNNITAPISDIEFSSDGKMLVSEKSMASNKVTSNFDYNSAHFSRVFEFEKSGGLWVSTHNFFIGNIYANTNSAGGVDYGYGIAGCDSITKQIYADNSFLVYQQNGYSRLSNCEQLIWASGDALRYPDYNPVGNASNYANTIYGIAGVPITGNSATANAQDWVKTTSIYVDLDSVWNVAKAALGDVDIYRLNCSLDNCTATDVVSQQEQIFGIAYPNPALNQLTVRLVDGSETPFKLQLTNPAGQLMMERFEEGNTTVIPLTGVVAGIYFVKIIQGNKATTVKISVLN